MNEAEPSPINLDELRMVPDWLRDDAPSPSKQYAGHNYPTDDRPPRRGPGGGGRPGGGSGFGGRPGGDRRDARGGSDRRRDGGTSRPGQGGPRGSGDRRDARDDRRQAPAPPPAPIAPAPVKVEFVPDERCLGSINKQIRATHMAYPLFGLARMFLQEPERHSVRFTIKPDAEPGTQLHQLGEDGPVVLDRSILEKLAFESHKDQFYTEQSVQKEPLKGNFTNVARERLSGTLLGPTNHHGYQPALRSLYEARYSRRMSFEDFRRNVEVSSDPALIERWKEEARTVTTITTKVGEGETPTELASLADARAHFRQHHLEALIKSGTRFTVHGSVARKLPEPALMRAIREAHDVEMRYPAQFVQLLRQGLQDSGLHIFKHRKRIVYVSLARPTPFVARGTVSPSVAAILETVAQNPLCTRKVLAEKVLMRNTESAPAPQPATKVPVLEASTGTEPVPATGGGVEKGTVPEPAASEAKTISTEEVAGENATNAVAPAVEEPGKAAEAAASVAGGDAEPVAESTPEDRPAEDPAARAKAALAADLRFLVQSGHIIEFHNGTFDLPLPPKAKEDGRAPSGAKPGGNNRPPNSGKKREESASSPAPASPLAPESSVSSTTDPGTAFVAEGADVEEAAEGSDAMEAVDTPSLLETHEPAPSAESSADLADAADASLSVEEVEIVPPGPEAVLVNPSQDKANHDGLISGPGAAPMDLPVPGDTEDAPSSRP